MKLLRRCYRQMEYIAWHDGEMFDVGGTWAHVHAAYHHDDGYWVSACGAVAMLVEGFDGANPWGPNIRTGSEYEPDAWEVIDAVRPERFKKLCKHCARIAQIG